MRRATLTTSAPRRAFPMWMIFGPALCHLQAKPATAGGPALILPEFPPVAALANELAWALVGSMTAIGLIIAALVWLGRRRARGSFHAKLKDYRGRAVDMMDRLDALKARLKALPIEGPTRSAMMSGETLELYRKVEGDLDRLWERWLEVMDVVDKAQTRAVGKLAEADKLVSDSKVFDEVEAGAQACSETLDRIDHAGQAAQSAAEAVAEARERAADRIKEVGEAGLPTAPHQPALDGIIGQEKQAREILAADPIGAKTILDAALADSQTLTEKADALIAGREEGDSERETLRKLRDDVAQQREAGLRLDEEGGDPNPFIASAAEALDELQTALEAGDPDQAAARLKEARDRSNAARDRLDAVVGAKALCAREIPERKRETQRLREAVPQFEAFEKELQRDYAADSRRDVSGNLQQARTLLETFDRKIGEAADAASDSNQKYLLGARLIAQIIREQQAVFQLMNAIAQRLSELKAVRGRAQGLATDFDDRGRRLRAYLDQNNRAIGVDIQSAVDALARTKDATARKMAETSPDWPSVQNDLAGAVRELEGVQTRAEADVKLYAQLMDELEQANREAKRVGDFLAAHSEDRVAANQTYRRAVDVLDRVGDRRTQAGNNWGDLLERVRSARADLNRAERLAGEDVRLARQAESELSEATRTIRQTRGLAPLGVAPNTSAAESLLDHATRQYHDQDYEQAIRSAGEAIQQARLVQNQASREVQLGGTQRDADQRRRATGLGDAAPPTPIAGDRRTDITTE